MKNFLSKLFRFGWEKHDQRNLLGKSTDLVDRTKAKSTCIWYSQSKLERMDLMAKCIMTWFEAVGRARAASVLTSMGMHKEARKLMTDDWK